SWGRCKAGEGQQGGREYIIREYRGRKYSGGKYGRREYASREYGGSRQRKTRGAGQWNCRGDPCGCLSGRSAVLSVSFSAKYHDKWRRFLRQICGRSAQLSEREDSRV